MHKFIVAVGSGFPVDEYQKKCAYFSKRNMHSPLVNQKWNQGVSGHLLILNSKSNRIMPGFNILWEPSKLLTFKSLSVNCYKDKLGIYWAWLCVGQKWSLFRMAAGGQDPNSIDAVRMDTMWWTHEQGLSISWAEILHILKKKRHRTKLCETFVHTEAPQMCLLTVMDGLFPSVIKKGMVTVMQLLGCTPELLVSRRQFCWILSGFISIRMNPLSLNGRVFPGNAASNIILSWYIHVCRLT